MVDSSLPTDERPPDEPKSTEPELDPLGSAIDDQGISLEELSRTYAQLIGKGEDPYESPQETDAPVAEEIEESPGDADRDDACPLCPRTILEAILFVGHPSNEPITSSQIAALMRGVPPREIDQLVKELNGEYSELEHPYQIASVGAGYQLELRDDFGPLRNVFYGRIREARLSQAAIDILAIIAYHQGRTREEIDRLRGRASGGILSQLVRRRLLRIERPDSKPRTPRYFTTDRFLTLFGLSDLEDLPTSQDVD